MSNYPKDLENYVPGMECECGAYCRNECGCDADWTDKEIYLLRREFDMLNKESPESQKEDLLPCPFCGSKTEKTFGQRQYDFCAAVECTNEDCGVSIHGYNSAEKWNRRPKTKKEENQNIESLLLDPHSVYLNFLHGKIAKLSWEQLEHIHGQHPAKKELEEMRKELWNMEDQRNCAMDIIKSLQKQLDEANGKQ